MNLSLTLDPEFVKLSQKLGANPLRIQGPGGNTSIKNDEMMWIKASGTELAEALDKPVFVAVELMEARRQAGGAGDGTCRDAVIDPEAKLRPSIETTFHAALEWPVVAHTHSIAALSHVTSDAGTQAALEKLADLPVVAVGYAKPGVPLTTKILEQVVSTTQVVLLRNHGLICCGNTPEEVEALMDEVENRLALTAANVATEMPKITAPDGFSWMTGVGALATQQRLQGMARAGSYYPDHVVFLGPALPLIDGDVEGRPAAIVPGVGVTIRDDATSAQRAMVQCLADLLSRVPDGWELKALAPDREAELLDWDAEKYRQALAERGVAN
jgi:rhamnose utilization protein RhaD (predicted bifunctional aldolase and dehydrogenase)